MGVEVSWDNAEKTLIRYDFSGRWTLQEFSTATFAAHKLINEAPHQQPTATLLNFGEKLYMPPNIISFAQERARHKHPRTTIAILVTNSNFVIVLLKTLLKVYPDLGNFYGQAKTLDEGRLLAYERIGQRSQK